MIKSLKIVFAVIAFTTFSVGQLNAGVITVTNDPSGTGRATFGGNDIVDWAPLGVNFTPLSNPFNHTSNGGINLTVSQAGAGQFERRNLGSGWGGNFTDGSELLWTGGGNAPVTISFNTAVSGVGFQINPNFDETSTNVSVFGIGNALLGSFNLTTNDRSTSSASFIGFKSNMTDITSIQIAQPSREDFAINQLSIISGQNVVPEPTSIALWSLGLAVMTLSRRRRA